MASHKEKCGCKWGELGWVELCAEHKAEHDEIHARAQRDYRRKQYPNDETPKQDNSDLL